MNDNIDKIKSKLQCIEKEKGVPYNSLLRLYMYEKFIEKLSKSSYSDVFVIKGGFYLCMFFGIENRSTMDIDISLKNKELNEENIKSILENILSIQTNEHVTYKVETISEIRSEDKYGGLRAKISFIFGKIKDSFHVDIATGDPIYPSSMKYNYKALFTDDTYYLSTYSIESILAEKIETVCSKLEFSSRSKDLYDIYIIDKLYFREISIDNFKTAVEKTFQYRSFKNDLNKCLEIISNSAKLEEYWKAYSDKNKFANNIKYSQVVDSLHKIVNIIIDS